jgi:hypothetical protein
VVSTDLGRRHRSETSPSIERDPVAPDRASVRDGAGVGKLQSERDAATAAAESLAEGQAQVTLRSEPNGAMVSHGARRLCFTPCRTDLPRGQSVVLSFRRRGYRAKNVVVVPDDGVVLAVELEPSFAGR